jgi:putative peptide zinc metalloprotease protein
VTHFVEAMGDAYVDFVGFELAEGVELVGPYRDGGFTEPLFLVRRADGRMAQLSQLPYLVLENFSISSRPEIVARRVSEVSDSKVWPSDVIDLARHRLAPIGLVRELPRSTDAVSSLGAEDRACEADRSAQPSSLLGLHFKFGALRPETVNSIADRLKPLFRPLVMTFGVGASLASYILLVWSGTARRSVGALVDRPGLLLSSYFVGMASLAVHELGHATACRFGGGTAGRIGVGLYLTWPVCFADMTDSYRLSRRGRLRTDTGGMYFNALLVDLFVVLYAVTRHPFFAISALLQFVIVFEQLLPIVRLDGYWITADLAGVPDLYRYVRPAFARVRRRSDPNPHWQRLSRRARFVVGSWVAVAIPVLVVNICVTLFYLTHAFRIGGRMASRDFGEVAAMFRGERPVVIGCLAMVEFVFLALPLLGLVLTAWLLSRALVRAVMSWTGRSRTFRTMTVTVLFALAVGLVTLGALQ